MDIASLLRPSLLQRMVRDGIIAEGGFPLGAVVAFAGSIVEEGGVDPFLAPGANPPALDPKNVPRAVVATIEAIQERRRSAGAGLRARWTVEAFASEVRSEDPADMARDGAMDALNELSQLAPSHKRWLDPSPGQGGDDESTARRDRLARLVHENLCSLWAHIGACAGEALLGWAETDPLRWLAPGAPGWDELGTLELDRRLAWDAWCAEWCGAHSNELVQELGERLRAGARDRWLRVHPSEAGPGEDRPVLSDPDPAGVLWDGWVDPNRASPVVRELAICLWADVLREMERTRSNPPALVLPFAEGFRATMVPAAQRDGLVVDAAGVRIPLVPMSLEVLLEPGLADLGSLTSHRLMRWMARTGWEGWANGNHEPGRVDIEGGWTGLAAAIGGTSKKDPKRVERIVKVWRHASVEWDAPAGAGSMSLLSGYTVVPNAGKRRAHITLYLSPLFLPQMVHRFPPGSRPPLVPVLPLPALVGRGQDRRAQAALQMIVLAEMRKRAGELATSGAIGISDREWAEMARVAGLPSSLLPRVLDAWTEDGDTPAFLMRRGRGWTLGDAHQEARDFLTAGGKRSQAGRLGGRKRTAAMRLKLDG